MQIPYDYNLFFDFINTYLPSGFLSINPKDSIIKELEDLMELNDQFLLVMNLTEIKIIYSSKRSLDMVGVEPAKLTPFEMMEAVHKDDIFRFGMGRTTMMNLDKELYIQKAGSRLLSTTIKMRNSNQEYSNLLFQCFLFYSSIPKKSVYEIQVHTNVDSFRFRKAPFHYYLGNNSDMFKFPDEDLLMMGPPFTSRELEIIRLIEQGLSSKQIANELFLSILTVDTHRSNILKKSGQTHVSDVIFDLKDQGLL